MDAISLTPRLTVYERSRAARAGVRVALLLALAPLVGCASTPLPADRLALAKAGIDRAEQAGAAAAAPTELAAARAKLAAAEASPHTQEGALASGRLAEEAELDARLAEVTAQTAHSKTAALELDKSLQALRTEATPAAP